MKVKKESLKDFSKSCLSIPLPRESLALQGG